MPKVTRKDYKTIKKLIDSGQVEIELFYNQYQRFKELFSKGIDTPIGRIFDIDDRYFHIIARHRKDMFQPEEIDNAIKTLTNPEEVHRTEDKNGIPANTFLRQGTNNEIIVATVRNGNIVTSYYPRIKYLNKKLEEGEKIYENKN